MSFLKRARLAQFIARKWFWSLFIYPQSRLTTHKLGYDEYWETKRPKDGVLSLSPSEQCRAAIIAPRIEKGKVTIGDIGSGPGMVLRSILQQRPGASGVAFDSSPRALEYVRTFGIEAELLDITASEAMARVRPCDYYIALEVLEHIPNSEEVLGELLKKSSRGVFFSVPNTGFFTYRLRLLLGKTPAQWIHMPNEHVRFWTIRDMRWWLSALGFTPYTIVPYQGVPFFNRIWPNLFAGGMVVFIPSPQH